jgi:hypothetical protein
MMRRAYIVLSPWDIQKATVLHVQGAWLLQNSVALGHNRLGKISIDTHRSSSKNSLIGIPSASMVKAMAFFAKEISEL